jgi:phosphoribosyl-AMP cyclohydrolase
MWLVGARSTRTSLTKGHHPRAAWFAGFFMTNLNFSKLNGLLPAIVQDAQNGRVLMLGFMNAEAFQRTIETGRVVFYSRSRQALWTKGETSGHFLTVREITTDCDLDCVLVRVDAVGPGVCHEGYESCFFRRWAGDQWTEKEPRAFDPVAVYGNKK